MCSWNIGSKTGISGLYIIYLFNLLGGLHIILHWGLITLQIQECLSVLFATQTQNTASFLFFSKRLFSLLWGNHSWSWIYISLIIATYYIWLLFWIIHPPQYDIWNWSVTFVAQSQGNGVMWIREQKSTQKIIHTETEGNFSLRTWVFTGRWKITHWCEKYVG